MDQGRDNGSAPYVMGFVRNVLYPQLLFGVRAFVALSGFGVALMLSEAFTSTPPSPSEMNFMGGVLALSSALVGLLIVVRRRTPALWTAMEMLGCFSFGVLLGVLIPVIYPLLEKIEA